MTEKEPGKDEKGESERRSMRRREKGMEREIFYVLVHFPNGVTGWVEARGTIGVSQMSGTGPTTWTLIVVSKLVSRRWTGLETGLNSSTCLWVLQEAAQYLPLLFYYKSFICRTLI